MARFIKLNFMRHIKNSDYQIGLERELHRIDAEFNLSTKNHPPSLGSSYFNTLITTDFAESQTELITNVCQGTNEAFLFLTNLIRYTAQNIGDEKVFNFSPPLVGFRESAKIAQFEGLKSAQKKRIYRQGLCHRYSKDIQLLTGFHFNFSFSDQYIKVKMQNQSYTGSLEDFKSELYLNVARNFMRYGWILIYLFGASPHLPCLDKTFKNACSLRTSSYGYSIENQDQVNPNLNSLDRHLEDLNTALKTPFPEYQNDNFVQLNQNIIQDPSEYYSVIRPKIHNSHIEFLELRCIDINPLMPYGIDLYTLDFTRDFLFYLSDIKSEPLSYKELSVLKNNFRAVGENGRDKGLTLRINNTTKPLFNWATEILKDMKKDTDILKPKNLASKKIQKYETNEDIKAFLQKCLIEHQQIYKKPIDHHFFKLFETEKFKSLEKLDHAKRT